MIKNNEDSGKKTTLLPGIDVMTWKNHGHRAQTTSISITYRQSGESEFKTVLNVGSAAHARWLADALMRAADECEGN